MNWTALKEIDLSARLSQTELSVLKRVGGSSSTTSTATLINQATEEARGYIAACSRNSLGPQGTLPESLHAAALDMVRYRLITRLPASGLMTPERKAEYQNALNLLEKVASCQFGISGPSNSAALRVCPRREGQRPPPGL